MTKSASLKLSVPVTSSSPLLLEWERIMRHSPFTGAQLARKIGMNPSTITGWGKKKGGPSLLFFERALNKLGYELVIRKKGSI